jgi:hypothetical protein
MFFGGGGRDVMLNLASMRLNNISEKPDNRSECTLVRLERTQMGWVFIKLPEAVEIA